MLKINGVNTKIPPAGDGTPSKKLSRQEGSWFEFIQINYNIIVPVFFIGTSLLLISKFPSYSFKKIVIQRRTTIFLLFGIVLFFGLLLIYPFNLITISAIIYLIMLPISYFHYKRLKKQNEDQNFKDDEDDLEDIL